MHHVFEWPSLLRNLCGLAILAAGVQLQASPRITALTPSLSAPRVVGTTVTWTVVASDVEPGPLAYRFLVKAPGAGAQSYVARDYHSLNTFDWVPSQSEGNYTIQAVAENLSTGKITSGTTTFRVTPVATGSTPVVSVTANPLVALYSAPPCPVGSTMAVFFKPFHTSLPTKATSQRSCTGNGTMNFYIAGMLPNSQYVLFHKVITGGTATSGPAVYFTSGPIPSDLTQYIPPFTQIRPVDAQSSTAEDMVMFDIISGGTSSPRFPIVTDLLGRPLWYYAALPPQFSRFFIRPLAGTMLIVLDDPTVTAPTGFQASQILREFDLAGGSIRETNVGTVARQVAALKPAWNVCSWTQPNGCAAGQTAILDFHHDAIRLPNNRTMVLMTAERVFTDGTQGSSPSNPVDILGDFVVALDDNLQVVWAWNSYEQLDLSRAAVLAETCASSGPGCPPINFMPVGNDWLHSNSLFYDPKDGNLIISMRHQDWVIKVNYAGGAGSGALMWRMGLNGDFTMAGSGDPYPWFSHQHHAGYDSAGQSTFSVFDNGNTRVTQQHGGNSRGIVLTVDEVNKTVTPILMADLGNYSAAVGSAQRLSNSNYSFGSGFVNPGPTGLGQSIEVTGVPQPSGTLNYTLQCAGSIYRMYRMSSFYKTLSK